MQRVQKKFNARRGCLDRTYEYYLPAHLLFGSGGGGQAGGAELLSQGDPRGKGGGGEGSGAMDDEHILSRFRTALAGFVGTHAFHNYTSGSGRRRAAAAASAGWRGGDKGAVSTSMATSSVGSVKQQGDNRADAADASASSSAFHQHSNWTPGDRGAASDHVLDAVPTVATSPQVLPATPRAVRSLDLHPDPGQQLHPGPRDERGGGSSDDDDEGADGGEDKREEEDNER